MKQSTALTEIIERSQELQNKAKAIRILPLEKLQQKEHNKAWNALECFQHLNYYIEIYNEQFKRSLQRAKTMQNDQELKHGYWGNKFIEMMRPKPSLNKMKTFASKNPIGKDLSTRVIDDFIRLNEESISLFEKARSKDIQRVKCKLALPLLKLNLGDAFQFIVQHNARHFVQIEKAINLQSRP